MAQVEKLYSVSGKINMCRLQDEFDNSFPITVYYTYRKEGFRTEIEPVIMQDSGYFGKYTYAELAELMAKEFGCDVVADIPEEFEDPDYDMTWLLINPKGEFYKADLKGTYADDLWEKDQDKTFFDVYRGNMQPLDKERVIRIVRSEFES